MTTPGTNANARISVVTIADDLAFQAALIAYLEEQDEFAVVGHAVTRGEALECPVSRPPRVILLDVRLRDGPGLELVGPLHARWPDSKIIVLTMFEVPALQRRAREKRISGYVAKADLVRDLLPTIREALHDSRFNNG
jgi:DNA-binding NarL/FixJ family response regulator